MKLVGVALTFLMLGSTLGCMGPTPLPRTQEGSRAAAASKRNEDAVLKYLRPALNSAGKAARLYYRAPCQATDRDPVPFPLTEVQPPSKGKIGVTAVREMFRNNKDVMVTEGRSEIIRIRIGKISAAILQTKISLLTLKPMGQYNPTLAISAIESTKDVEVAMRRLGLRLPPTFFVQLLAEPAKGLPHLPPSMRNVTVDQALDSVAKTFRGIVIYGACPRLSGVRFFWIDFAGVVP